jgi:hypothetical protein
MILHFSLHLCAASGALGIELRFGQVQLKWYRGWFWLAI